MDKRQGKKPDESPEPEKMPDGQNLNNPVKTVAYWTLSENERLDENNIQNPR